MRKHKKIIISICSLALCILVTFAWINELQNPSGQVLKLTMTDASVANSSLTVNLYHLNEDEVSEGEEKNPNITDIVEDNETEAVDPVDYEDFAPGCRKKFKIELTNKGHSSVRLRISLLDIICENEELRNCVIIGTNGFEGFNSNYPAPRVQTKMLAEGMDEKGTLTLVDYVEIPPGSLDENDNVIPKTVSIYFYVMFSASGSENLEDISFSIGKINFLTL